jgi:hypothetical protein
MGNAFKQIGVFDPVPIAKELENTVLWNWMNIRRLNLKTDHYQVEDIILRYQKVTFPCLMEDFYEDMECVDYFVQGRFPKTLFTIAKLFLDKEIGRIVIAKLKAGAHITPHKDEGKYCEAHDRYHLPIITNDRVFVTSNNETIHMPIGTIWWFDNKKVHEVINKGSEDRVHIIVDILK